MTFKVYLSGPITGLHYNESVAWTDYACEKLATNRILLDDGYWFDDPTDIVGYKPLRGKKEVLQDVGELQAVINVKNNPHSTNHAIFRRDKYDVMSCDCVLVNLLGAKRVSIGTCYEMAWADMLQKPLVLVMEETLNFHEHAFVLESATHMTTNLDEGIEVVKTLLLPD